MAFGTVIKKRTARITWLRNRNTLEFLGVWEQIHNPDFNCAEFGIIKSQAGLNSFRISVTGTEDIINLCTHTGLKQTDVQTGFRI